MPSEVVNSRIIPEQGQEVILLMDDYGTALQIYVAVSDSANRQSHIADGIALQDAGQTSLEQYAAIHSIDLSSLKAAGLAKKAAAKG
jgi:hypothetical protein